MSRFTSRFRCEAVPDPGRRAFFTHTAMAARRRRCRSRRNAGRARQGRNSHDADRRAAQVHGRSHATCD